jgi:hypothetical protein
MLKPCLLRGEVSRICLDSLLQVLSSKGSKKRNKSDQMVDGGEWVKVKTARGRDDQSISSATRVVVAHPQKYTTRIYILNILHFHLHFCPSRT